MSQIDFLIADHGTIFLLHPQTDSARDWATENLEPDHTMIGNAIAIEHRYIEDIVNGVLDAGLTVSR